MVSMKDIAKKCGVSVATVSKALNDQSDISDSMKQHIRKVADELNYVANANARTLKTNKTKNIGVIFEDAQNAGLGHEFFAKILESFRATVEKKDYDITFLHHLGSTDTYLKHCLYRNFDGVVIVSALSKSEEINELINSDIPTISVDTPYENCCSVVSNHMDGICSEVNYAIERGHRNIVFMTGEDGVVTSYRLVGFYKSMMDHHLPITPDTIVQSTYHDIVRCYNETIKILERKHRPTCIIFPDDYSYYGGLQAILEKGLEIPKDISVIGYDGIQIATTMGLTTYQQNTQEIGRLAGEKLMSMIENKTTSNETIMVNGNFIKGKTVQNLK